MRFPSLPLRRRWSCIAGGHGRCCLCVQRCHNFKRADDKHITFANGVWTRQAGRLAAQECAIGADVVQDIRPIPKLDFAMAR
jgi:hypothetical protein